MTQSVETSCQNRLLSSTKHPRVSYSVSNVLVPMCFALYSAFKTDSLHHAVSSRAVNSSQPPADDSSQQTSTDDSKPLNFVLVSVLVAVGFFTVGFFVTAMLKTIYWRRKRRQSGKGTKSRVVVIVFMVLVLFFCYVLFCLYFSVTPLYYLHTHTHTHGPRALSNPGAVLRVDIHITTVCS